MKIEKTQHRNTKDHDTTMSNYMTTKWTTWKKQKNSQKSIIFQN